MHIEKLANAIDPERVSVDAEDLDAHRFDRWCLKHWQDWQGETLPTPGRRVRPAPPERVQPVLLHASEPETAVITVGGGSGAGCRA